MTSLYKPPYSLGKRCKESIMLCLFAGLATFTPLRAQENSFDLKACINYALKNHTEIINAQLKEIISREKIKEVKSIRLPQISGGLSYQHNFQIPVVLSNGEILKMEAKHRLHPSINADQILYNPNYHGNILLARLQAELSQYDTKRSKIEIVASVMKAYYNVIVTRKRLELIETNISRLKKSLTDTQLRYKNGLAQKVDVNRIQVLYNNALTEKKNTLRLMGTQEKLLKFQMGMNVDQPLNTTGQINEKMLDGTTSHSVKETFYKNRIEYILAEKQWELSRLQTANVKREYLPSLSLFGSYQIPLIGQDFRQLFSLGYYPASFIGVRLQVPIFSGFKKKYQLNQAKLREEIALNQMSHLKNNIRYELSQMDQQFENALNNLQTQKENIELAQLNYNNLKYQYENGVRPNIEVLNAQNALKEAETYYINALYEALINKVDLDKALGRIPY